jgi:hypothetical protein
MRSGNQNLGRDLIYGRIDQVLDRLEASLSIESITQSKLGNKLSSVYNQLLQINDTGSSPVKIPKKFPKKMKYNALCQKLLGLIKQIRNKVVAYFVQPQSLQSKNLKGDSGLGGDTIFGSSSGKGPEGKMMGSIKSSPQGFVGSTRDFRLIDGDSTFLRSEGKVFGY